MILSIYGSIFVFLFLMPFVVADAESNPIEEENFRTVIYVCLGAGKMKFMVNLTENDSISDIFSTDARNSCSLSNHDFTGNGTADFPYEIIVDVSKHIDSIEKPCGAKVYNESFKVQFAIKSGEIFFLKHDRLYSVECRLQNPQVSVFSVQSAFNHLYNVPMQMNLVAADSGDILNKKVKLGRRVKLRVTLLEQHFAKRMRVTLCSIKDTQSTNTNFTFYNNKCPMQSFPVDIDFLPNKTNPTIIETSEFEVFRFFNNKDVEFHCFVELCIEKDDPYCHQTDCVPKGIFMRPYAEVKTVIHTVLTDSSVAISSSSFIQIFFPIFITIFGWL